MSDRTASVPLIVHVTSSHRADDVRIFRRECVSLAKAGYRVCFVVAGAEDTEIAGVRILGTRGGGGRLMRFLLNPLLVLWRAMRLRPSILHVHDPELLPWVPILRLFGIRVVADLHENLAGLLASREWVPRSLAPLGEWLVRVGEGIAVRSASGVVVAGEDIAERWKALGPVLVNNYPAAEDIPTTVSAERQSGTVIFAGTIARGRAIRELIDAMELLNRQRPARLRLLGRFSPPALKDEVAVSPGWQYVDYLGLVDRPVVAREVATATVGVALLLPAPNHYTVRANKLFEYMAAGVPVLGSDFPAWRSFIERWGCGRVVDPTDPKAIADALEAMLANAASSRAQGVRGRDAVVTTLNWSQEAPRLVSLYRRLLGESRVGM